MWILAWLQDCEQWLQVKTKYPYLTLSSLRWSMLRGFLLSARIFFFFSLSVCFFAPFFPSCWMGRINPSGCVDRIPKKEEKYQRCHKVWFSDSISYYLKCKHAHCIHGHGKSLCLLSFISATVSMYLCVGDWPSVGHHHTAESCLSEPSSSWRPHPASYVPPPAPSSPFLPVEQMVIEERNSLELNR